MSIEGALSDADIVKGTFQTDPISALGLPSPVTIGADATVGDALSAVQTTRSGYVLLVEDGRPRSLLTERDVLMKIVARDVHYDVHALEYASPVPATLTERGPIARALRLMIEAGMDNIPIVDEAGRATAVLRT